MVEFVQSLASSAQNCVQIFECVFNMAHGFELPVSKYYWNCQHMTYTLRLHVDILIDQCMYIAGKDNTDIVTILTEHQSVDFSLKNKRGFNPLHHAALKGNAL